MLSGMRSQVVGSLSAKRQLPVRPVSTIWSRSKPPGGQPEGDDRGVAARPHDQLVGVGAARVLRQRERAERLVGLAQHLPFAEHLVGGAGLGLDGSHGLQEEQALAFALALEQSRSRPR